MELFAEGAYNSCVDTVDSIKNKGLNQRLLLEYIKDTESGLLAYNVFTTAREKDVNIDLNCIMVRLRYLQVYYTRNV